MTGPSRSSVLSELRELGAQETPAPRPDFLAELEVRLHEPDGPVATVDTEPLRIGAGHRVARSATVGAVALVAAAVVIALGLSGVGPAQRIRTTPSGEGRGSAGDEGPGGTGRATGSHAGDGTAADSTVAPANGDPHASGSTAPKPGSLATASGTGPSSTLGSYAAAEGDTAATTKTSTVPRAFAVRGSGTAARIFLDWDAYKGDDFVAYLVLRSIAPDDPTYPADNQRTLIMLRIEDRGTTTYQDTPKVGSTCRYRIVVVDKDGNTVAASNVVDPTANPGPPNTTAALPRFAVAPPLGIQSPAVSTS
jgi:hypothetical protein